MVVVRGEAGGQQGPSEPSGACSTWEEKPLEGFEQGTGSMS